MSERLAPIAWSQPLPGGGALRGWHSEPSGRPLLFFLHGNGLCARAYTPLLAALAVDFDLLLIDAPGHGGSDNPGGRFSGWDDNALRCFDALAALAPRFGAVPRLGLGHSFGAVLSIHGMAARPEALRGAVLLDPVLFGPGLLRLARWLAPTGALRLHPLARAAARRRDHFADRAAAHARWQGKAIYARWHPAALAAYVHHGLCPAPGGGVQLACARALESEIFRSLPLQLPRRLRALQRPLEAIIGRHSYGFVRRGAPRYGGPGSPLRYQYTEGGHNFCLEQPTHSAGLVGAAVQRLLARSR